jgi:hypothetical protein
VHGSCYGMSASLHIFMGGSFSTSLRMLPFLYFFVVDTWMTTSQLTTSSI